MRFIDLVKCFLIFYENSRKQSFFDRLGTHKKQIETKMKKYTWMLLLFLFGCASQQEDAPFEINSKQLYKKLDGQGNKIFAYVVSVKASSRKSRNSDRPLTRSEFKRFAEQEYFEESNSLKLELENHAVALLKAELEQQQYCPDKYEIDNVVWRDLSVQLRGRCL